MITERKKTSKLNSMISLDFLLGSTFGIVEQGGDDGVIKLRKQKLEFNESEEARNNKAEFHRGRN